MILKRICLAALIFSFGVAGTAQARTYALAAGSGAQLHIGGGLALPIQPAATVLVTGTVFPPLLIPAAVGAGVAGTTTETVGQRLTVPKGVLQKLAAQKTVGVFFSNPTLYAVATNLSYSWPAASAVFSKNGARPNAAPFTIAVGGNSIRYGPKVPGSSKRFGGAAAFALKGGPADGLHADSPVTIYAIAVPGPDPAGNPPCTHPAFGGTNGNCFAALIDALPTGLAAIGQAANVVVTTPGGVGGAPAVSGIAPGKFGGAPSGTVISKLLAGPVNNGLTNAAVSNGFPFTTGKITMSAPPAAGAPEVFMISGNDLRTTMGAGTLQMVAGALSTRTTSGPNANRGWVRLVLSPMPPVPAMSTLAQGVMIVLLMLVPAIYFGMRARRQAV